jgi:uncharacterized membrane protein
MEAAGETGAALHADVRALARRSLERAARTVAPTRAVVHGGAGIYALLLVVGAVVHFEALRAGRADLGSMAQAVWSTAHGHFLETTSMAGQEITRLGVHVDPFLALLVPFWWAWPSPLMLLVVQVVAVSTGALPVYWLARKHLQSERAAAHFAFAYLVFPATQFNALTISSGFHAVSIAVPLILFAIWFLDEERLVLFTLFALLAASTKEEIPLAVGCLGIWYAVRSGKRLTGLTIFAAGLALTIVDFLVVIPHYARTGIDPFAARYSGVGTTPTGILHKAVSDPVALLQAVATGHKLLYVVLLLGPFLGLWLLEPLLFLGAIPDLAINLLSSKSDQTSIVYHWTAGIIPFTVAASVLGAARLKRDPDRVSLYALVGAGCLAVVSPLTVAIGTGDFAAALPSSSVRAARGHALNLVPAGAPVSASNELATYLSARRYVYVFPVIRDAHWLVLDQRGITYRDKVGYRGAVRAIESSPNWKIVYAAHGVDVLRRVGSTSQRR